METVLPSLILEKGIKMETKQVTVEEKKDWHHPEIKEIALPVTEGKTGSSTKEAYFCGPAS